MSDFRPRPEPFRGSAPRPVEYGGAGQRQGGYPTPAPFQPPSEQQLKEIIQGGNAELLVKSAEDIGKALAQMRLTTSQIRGVFGTVRQIQMKWPAGSSDTESKASIRQLLLLKPKLAYQQSRDQDKRGQGVQSLNSVLIPAIDLVTTREQFTHFAEYFEAILAYHRASGGRDYRD